MILGLSALGAPSRRRALVTNFFSDEKYVFLYARMYRTD